ncbi:S-layer homology domain-containing protein [Egicoccus sp. AB-alg6-2]|uniref:S-layer homology domain-containing protein n=1 Tax=Egicoccus sp. AB-alg6-2 TaxID=3242692 RepID=UPI00359EF1D8
MTTLTPSEGHIRGFSTPAPEFLGLESNHFEEARVSITHRVRRTLGVAMAGAMVLSLLPAGAAFADNHEDVCADAPESTDFQDHATISATFREYVECMQAYGIAAGFPDGTYRPGQHVTRQQMALFIARFIEQAENGNTTVPPTAASDYPDRENATPEAQAAIDYLTERGIVEGFRDGTYRPGANVTRAQMASYIARAMEEVGAELPEGDGDNYPDVDDDATHSDNINKLTEAGIVRGFGDGTYRPGANVTRQQMAQFIILGAAELHEQGLWEGEFEEEPTTPTTNQTFTVTTGEAATNEVGDGRTYTVTGLDDTETYNIALFEAGSVTVATGDVVSFDEDGTTGTADQGDIAAVITHVNNLDVVDADQQTAVPVGGTITFRINSDLADSVFPVVWLDEDGADFTALALDVDEDGLPTEDFGVGGQKTWIPTEAEIGSDHDGEVTTIDAANNWYMLDTDGDGRADVVITYVAGDTFRYNGASISLAQFEAWASAGDTIQVTDYNPGGAEPGDATIHDIVEDVTAAPANVTVVADEDDIVVDWDAPSPAEGRIAGYEVWLYEADAADTALACAGTDVDDASTTAAVTEYTFEGLVDGEYCVEVYAVSFTGHYSDAVAVQVEVDTTVPAEPATITDIDLTDTVIEGLADAGDVWELTFAEDMDTANADDIQIRVQDGDGDATIVVCYDVVAVPGSSAAGETSAECTWDTTGDDDVLVVTLLEEADDRTIAGDGNLTYPLEITAVTGLNVDLTAGVTTIS